MELLRHAPLANGAAAPAAWRHDLLVVRSRLAQLLQGQGDAGGSRRAIDGVLPNMRGSQAGRHRRLARGLPNLVPDLRFPDKFTNARRLNGKGADAMNNPDDWSAWLEQHGAGMLLVARQSLPSHADAEDVVQEGFLRFWQSRHRAQDPVAYLFTCVRHCTLDFHRGRLRRHDRERAAARPEHADDFFSVAPQERERAARIEQALRQLPPSQREILVLKLWSRLSFAQIAAALEISPNTAASRYRYALEKLRVHLPEEQVS
jgi:RNA polymerase sigma-70 factor (ECF subfamily)